jgi:hypothetical protein
VKDDLADIIAFFAIYMPIIRTEVVAFTELWNNHSIRAQKQRPNHIKGKPRVNYLWPKGDNVKNWGIPINPEKIKELQADLDGWGTYLMHCCAYFTCTGCY